MFQNTIKAFEECKFDFAFIARYSVRPGTLASKMYPDDVPDDVKAERWHILNDILLKNLIERNKLMLDRIEPLMITGKKDGFYFGRTRNFKEVFFTDESETIKN
jgi:tRNA-2-methylthio-N6-dimethylallyladenosine synthase